MKSLTRLVISFFACGTLVLTAFAGPEHISSKDKEVMAAPAPSCNWSGFYVGVVAGGAFGSNRATDIDGYNSPPGINWDYQVGGFTGGAEAGYNFQFGSFVLGPEVDLGYMSLGTDHRSIEPVPFNANGKDTFAQNDSNFYTTLRARLGWTTHNWLLFITGGGIGLNDQARVSDDCITGNCGGDTLNDRNDYDFLFGWTVGGGVEYMFNCHWSMKVEYLYFNLGDDTVTETNRFGSTEHFGNEIDGNVVRLGLNFKF
jgi:outer membrane immunogenic protein